MSTRIQTTGSHARFMRAVNEELGKFRAQRVGIS
jgi:hypothetical protein